MRVDISRHEQRPDDLRSGRWTCMKVIRQPDGRQCCEKMVGRMKERSCGGEERGEEVEAGERVGAGEATLGNGVQGAAAGERGCGGGCQESRARLEQLEGMVEHLTAQIEELRQALMTGMAEMAHSGCSSRRARARKEADDDDDDARENDPPLHRQKRSPAWCPVGCQAARTPLHEHTLSMSPDTHVYPALTTHTGKRPAADALQRPGDKRAPAPRTTYAERSGQRPAAGHLLRPSSTSNAMARLHERAPGGSTRSREARQALTGCTCAACREFFDTYARDDPQRRRQALQRFSRHRSQRAPPSTPSFWRKMEFTPSDESEGDAEITPGNAQSPQQPP
eukprot:ctg_588.g267